MPRDESPAEAAGDGESIWRIPVWRWAFPASVISRLGDVVFDVTVILWISTELAQGRDWAPAAVSGVLVCAAVPVVGIGPLAGVWVDRLDRARILQMSNLVQAAASASLLVMVALGDSMSMGARLGWLYLAVLVSNGAAQFFNQARTAMILVTIPDALRTSAYSAQMSAVGLVAILAPPLAAPVFFTGGAGWAVGLNAASFVVSSVLLGRARWDGRPARSAGEESFGQSLRAGLTAVRSNTVLVTVAVALTVVTFGVGAMSVLEVFFVTEVLGAPAEMVGVLLTTMAAGSLTGALIAPRIERRVGAARILAFGLGLAGVLTMAYSRASSLSVALVLLGLSAVPLGAVNTVFMPMVLRSLRAEVVGRATVVLHVFPVVASLLAMAATGWLTSTVLRGLDLALPGTRVGPVDGPFLLAGVLFALSGLFVAWSLGATSEWNRRCMQRT